MTELLLLQRGGGLGTITTINMQRNKPNMHWSSSGKYYSYVIEGILYSWYFNVSNNFMNFKNSLSYHIKIGRKILHLNNGMSYIINKCNG